MRTSLFLTVALLLGMLVSALAWRWLAANDMLSADYLAAQFSTISAWRGHPLLIPGVILCYSLLLLTMFPLTILVITGGLLFGPEWGLFYATLGTLSSSVVSYLAGRQLGQAWLLRHGGRRLGIVSRYLGHRGIQTMIVINLLPLAPFTMTNMLAGASHIRFRDYLIGSTIGILPGLALVTLLGSQLGTLLSASGRREWLLSLGILILLLSLWLLIRWRMKRWTEAQRSQ